MQMILHKATILRKEEDSFSKGRVFHKNAAILHVWI